LANDTHLPVTLPGVFYQVHLNGGRYHVTGVSFPGVPGVVIGHNEHCAWGLTTGWQDAQDLFVEKMNPANPHQYEYEGSWRNAQVVQETIHVKGRSAPVIQEVVITRHGPIVSDLVGAQAPLALRWVALEQNHLLRSVLAYDRAKDWQEFRAALADWAAPAHNFVYADTAGNIGYLQAGWVPVRAKGYGMTPVPGWTGEFEWQRYLTLDELPQAFNPAQGWIGVANNVTVDAAYPHFLSSDLENPCRATRVADLLAQNGALSAADCARFQMDSYSAQAERFVRHLLAIQPTNTRENDVLTLLRNWDYRMEPDSVAASIYHACRLQALHIVFAAHLGELTDDYVGIDTLSPLGGTSPYHGRSFIRLLDMLDNPKDTAWLFDPESGLPRFKQEVIHRSLRQALKLMRAELGDDMQMWTWGRLNRVVFAHPLGAVKPLDRLLNRGPYPLGGDHDTLLRASGKPVFPFEPVLGVAAMRFVADVSDWEECRMVVPAGQSGHVASRHYADTIPLWRNGDLLPMPFSRDAVEEQAKERLLLALQ
jgi:penicillin amidase